MRSTIIKNETHGVLGRLLADQSGNVIAIMAAALIPLVGIVGGGVDMSRAYMTKARLQAACDAGSLAGRRAMTNLTYPTAAKDKADKMFGFNFKSSDYDATNVTFTTSVDSKGKVSGTATAKIPTTLMKIFGKQNFELSTTCNADFQVPNIDTVLVLDVTGSMADCPDDSSCGGNASSKIAGLKTAVRSFYDTLETAGLSNPSTQLRYGFVPYSQTTNGKDMFVQSPLAHQLPLTQLVDSSSYQSRVAEFTTLVSSGTAVAGTVTSTDVYFRSGIPNATTNTPISNYDCGQYSDNIAVQVDAGPSQGVYTPDPIGTPLYRANSSSAWSTTIPTSGNYQQIDFSRNWTLSPDFSATSVGDNASTFKTCARIEKITDYTRGAAEFGFTKWIYKPVTYDVSSYKAGTALNYVRYVDQNATVPISGTYTPVQLRAMADQSKFTQDSTTWNGCLEERSTVADATFSPIPSSAKDLDYLNLGTNDATKWRPILRGLGYIRNAPAQQEQLSSNLKDTNGNLIFPTNVNQVNGTCPAATMRNLLEISSTDINTFISTLAPGGNTYHDIGMAWGLRLISPNGMFASRNGLASNGGQISRNIIFMTDGSLLPNSGTYSSYGYERVDQRISGGNNTPDLITRHARRFQALCDAARSQGIAVWTIAFGTDNPSNLVACADPGRAYVATNTAALTLQFQEIAKSIADLRLTQ